MRPDEPGVLIAPDARGEFLPTVFLDRDGVLNVDHGYVGHRDRWDWMPGCLDALAYFSVFARLVVVTNQSGIARGMFSEAEFLELTQTVDAEIRAGDGRIDAWIWCPTHPEATVEEFRGDSVYRKPNPGMIQWALDKWPTDIDHSVLVGDSERDLEAARRAGIRPLAFEGWEVALPQVLVRLLD